MSVLSATKRDLTGKKVKLHRAKNEVPASMYGPKFDSINLLVDQKEVKEVFKQSGYNKVIDVKLDKQEYKCLIREIQYDPVTADILHVSFYKPDLNKMTNVTVPFKINGVSLAVKNNIGFLVNPIDSLPLRALPNMIPEYLDVDISKLDKIGDSVLIKDLKLPEGVELQPKVNPSLSVVTIVPPQKEIVEEVKQVAETTEVTPEATAEAGATPTTEVKTEEVKKVEKK